MNMTNLKRLLVNKN